MKISDLSTKEQTNEEFADWATDTLARTGIMGQANKKSAEQKKQNERAKDIGLKDFTNKLSSALQSAIKGGIVTSATPVQTQPGSAQATSTGQDIMNSPAGQQAEQKRKAAQLAAQQQIDKTAGGAPLTPAQKAATTQPEPSMSQLLKQRQQQGLTEYKLFDSLVENKMLNEAESVSKFITDFISNQTRGLVDNPNYQKNIEMIAKKLEDSYAKTKRLDSSLVEQAWETIWAWSQLGSKRGSSGGREQVVDMDHDGTDDSIQRDNIRKSLIQIINKTDFNDPQKLKTLEQPIADLLKMIQATK